MQERSRRADASDVRIRVLGMDTGDAIRARNAAPVEGTDTRSAGATNHDVGAEKPVDAVDDTPSDARVVTVASTSVEAGTSATAVPELATTDVNTDLPTIEVDRVEAETDLDVFTKVESASARIDVA